MLIFLIAVSVVAVMVFVEWQYSVMSRRVRARIEDRKQTYASSRTRRR